METSREAKRLYPLEGDVAIVRLRRYLKNRFPHVHPPVYNVHRARPIKWGFAADVELFDGGRCILIVTGRSQKRPTERWCMRGKYSPHSTGGFYFSISKKCWVRATDEEAAEAKRNGDCL